MSLLEKLRARLAEVAGELDELNKKDLAALSADELSATVKALEEKTAEVEDLEAKVKVAEKAEEARARQARPAHAPADPDPANPAAVREPLKSSAKIGLLVAGMVKAFTTEGTKGARPVFRALDEMGYGEVAKEFESGQYIGGIKSMQRTLNSANATAGGILLPEDMSSDVIDLLRPNATFLQGNPIVVPMPNGTFKQPAAASGATAEYRGETKRASVSQPTFRAINMSAKLLAGIVPLSTQIIRWSLPNIQAWVERDLSSAMGLKMDLAAFRGDGLQDSPLGITNIPGVYRVSASGGATPSYTQIDADAAKLELRMESVDLPLIGVEWRMSPRTIKYLQNLRDGNGNKIYPELSQANPVFRMRPVRVTNQIPNNLGVSTQASEIYLVAFGHVMFGDALAMQMAISDQATVVNGNQTINTWQDGVIAIKAEAEHDFDVRYVEAVAVLEDVLWGA